MNDSVKQMIRDGGDEVTRENYIDLSYAGLEMPEWTPEHEALLPDDLQDWSLFEMQDGQLVLKDGAYPNVSDA